MKTILNLTTVLWVAAAAAQGLPDPAGNEAPLIEHVFEDSPAAREIPELGQGYTAYGQRVVRFDVLDSLAPGQPVMLELAEGVGGLVEIERVQRRSPTQYSVFGRFVEEPGSRVILVREQEAVAMFAILPSANAVFQLRYLGQGVHLIVAVHPERLPPCDGASDAAMAPAPEELPRDPRLFEGPPPGTSELPAGACQPEPSKYDVLILFSDDAVSAAGGFSAMAAHAQATIDLTNDAYANSQIATRTRLVCRVGVQYDETGDYSDHLDRLTENGDGILDIAHELRDTYRADVVALWVDDNQACGRAWCNATASSAFSVTKWDCFLTHAHEVGHNQGCAHDEANIDCDGRNSWSRGWRFFGNDGNQYHTVMAYAPGMPIVHFSNPNVLFQGSPTGVPIGDPDEAFNARTVNDTESNVRNFRLTRMDVWVDFDSGLPVENGTFGFPYDTLAEGVSEILVPLGASELPTLWIRAGQSGETMVISKAMVIRACGGLVRLGG